VSGRLKYPLKSGQKPVTRHFHLKSGAFGALVSWAGMFFRCVAVRPSVAILGGQNDSGGNGLIYLVEVRAGIEPTYEDLQSPA
jgi:hypothetical protein